MAKITKTVPMLSVTSATRAANTYARPTGSPRFLYTSANWSATTVTIYFEAVLKTSAGTGYATLYTTGGSAVSGAEVSTASTSTVRVRSGAITLTDATQYEVRTKNSGTNTTTLYDARIIFVLDGTISACETHIPMQSLRVTTTSTTYANAATSNYVLQTDANWDNATFYLEGTLSNNTAGNIGYAQLATTGGSAVSGSAISVTGTTYARAVSSSFTLTDATEYVLQIKANATTARISDARIVVVQSSPTKTENHYVLKNSSATTTSTTAVDQSGRLYWDNDEYSVSSMTHYQEATMTISNASGTATMEIYDGSSVIDSITRTGATAKARVRGSSVSLSDNTEYLPRLKTSSASYTATGGVPKIVSVVVISSASTAVKDVIGMGFIPFAR